MHDRQERMKLIRRYEEEMVRQPDSLHANLGLIAADLMRRSYDCAAHLDSLAQHGAEGNWRTFERKSDLYLKFVRQIDRLTQVMNRAPARSRDVQTAQEGAGHD